MISKEAYERKEEKLIRDLLKVKKKGGRGIALNKSTSNLFRYRNQKNVRRIDVHNFNNVISINNQVAEVEGMTTYETLVRETLKHGLIPSVVPQLKTITIGGAVSGIGIESSSFQYGLVHETIKEIEVLLPDGKVVVCSPNNQHKDLFFGFPNSYGTLGYALKIKVRLIPAKKFVKIEHFRYTNSKDYFSDLEKYCKRRKHDFVDGTIFNENEMYVTLGVFTDKAPFTSDYTGKNIYYKSIRKRSVDYLTAHDYIWRWDTDWFWCSKHFFVQNHFIRFLFGKRNLNSKTYWKIRNFAITNPFLKLFKKFFTAKESVVQDVEIPVNNCASFIDFFHKKIKIKPIWVCPVQSYTKKIYGLYPMNPKTLYINFGFWDVVKAKKNLTYYNRLIEKKVQQLNGKKSLYSTSYYDKDTFWKLYNGKVYDKLKRKYDPPNVLRDLYEKCVLRR